VKHWLVDHNTGTQRYKYDRKKFEGKSTGKHIFNGKPVKLDVVSNPVAREKPVGSGITEYVMPLNVKVEQCPKIIYPKGSPWGYKPRRLDYKFFKYTYTGWGTETGVHSVCVNEILRGTSPTQRIGNCAVMKSLKVSIYGLNDVVLASPCYWRWLVYVNNQSNEEEMTPDLFLTGAAPDETLQVFAPQTSESQGIIDIVLDRKGVCYPTSFAEGTTNPVIEEEIIFDPPILTVYDDTGWGDYSHIKEGAIWIGSCGGDLDYDHCKHWGVSTEIKYVS